MDTIPDEIIDHVFWFFGNLKHLSPHKRICHRFYQIVHYKEQKWLSDIFSKIIIKLCQPQSNICESHLLRKLNEDALLSWKTFENSFESSIIVINDAKKLLYYRSLIQTSFCILQNWYPPNEINLFSKLRKLIAIDEILQPKELSVMLNKTEAEKQCSLLKSLTSKSDYDSLLKATSHLTLNNSVQNGKILTGSERFHSKNFRNAHLFAQKINIAQLCTEDSLPTSIPCPGRPETRIPAHRS